MTAVDFAKKLLKMEDGDREDAITRVACDKVGEDGHRQCGWCRKHDAPRFECGCTLFRIKVKR